jgi:hypothetical protein
MVPAFFRMVLTAGLQPVRDQRIERPHRVEVAIPMVEDDPARRSVAVFELTARHLLAGDMIGGGLVQITRAGLVDHDAAWQGAFHG